MLLPRLVAVAAVAWTPIIASWCSGAHGEVVLLRERAVPDDRGAGDVRTHERLVVTLAAASNSGSPAWRLFAFGSCALTVSDHGGGSATVTRDPAEPPCPSNPPTPFTVDLDEPLGDRLLLDASTLPPRPITLPSS